MKIGILTFHFTNNYGALLQAYGLQHTLSGLGHDVDIVRYYPVFAAPRPRNATSYAPKGDSSEALPQSKKTSLKSRKNRFGRMAARLQGLPKKIVFLRFKKKFLNLTKKYLTPEAFFRDIDRYDILITGSDQVWNVGGIFKQYDPVYFLDYPGQTGPRRVSYAACFGTRDQPGQYISLMRNALLKFDYLSVRNVFSRELVKEISGLDAHMVVDPTFLASFEDVMSKKRYPGNYILVYPLLYQLNAQLLSIAEQIKKLYSMPIVAIGSPEIFAGADVYHKNVGPAEFLALFRDASYICTTSFHGTVFAIKHRKPFSTAIEGWKSERMRDFLRHYQLDQRLLTPSDSEMRPKSVDLTINYDQVWSKINEDIRFSIEYIQTALRS